MNQIKKHIQKLTYIFNGTRRKFIPETEAERIVQDEANKPNEEQVEND